MHRRLAWGPVLGACINAALDGGVRATFIEDTVDPLKKNLVIDLRDRLPNKDCWNAFQTLAHGYASANDCLIQKIRRRGNSTYVAEVCIKYRGGPTMDNDPFLMDKWKSGKQKRREKYIQFLRDKGVDIKGGLLR